MSSNFVEEQKNELSNNSEKQVCEKKPLRNVLSSYMKKKNLDEKSMRKMKKEFSDIKNNMNEAKNSFETLMGIQEKLSGLYNKLSETVNE